MSERRILVPGVLELETHSTCNRFCPTCIRNSEPDREAAQPWFDKNEMPRETVSKALIQGRELGIGSVCLSHYNEPLQDLRIAEFARLAKDLKYVVYIHTNGDFLIEDTALELDGVLDVMTVALYMDQPQKNLRERWIRSLFKKTRIEMTGGVHIPTHYSPGFDTQALIQRHAHLPCSEPKFRLIIDHRGKMLLCCDDLTGHFDLGTFPEKSLEELWFSDVHQDIVVGLQEKRSRGRYPYCATCPRP